jgi:hypothetical protein
MHAKECQYATEIAMYQGLLSFDVGWCMHCGGYHDINQEHEEVSEDEEHGEHKRDEEHVAGGKDEENKVDEKDEEHKADGGDVVA